MTLFQRYLFRQGLWPLLTALLALTGLAVMTQSLSNIELISSERETAFAFVWITLLAMPQIIAMILPVAVFLAVAISMNRLISDSELTVGAAAGMSRGQRMSPFIRIAVFAMLGNLVINLFLQPVAFREMRESVYEIRSDLVADFMRPGEFTDLGGNVTFYTRSLDDNGVMSDVFIQDGRGTESRAYAAGTGLITRTSRGPVMLLQNGQLSQTDEQGELSTLAFERYEFELNAFLDPTSAFFFKESDRFLPELLMPTAADIVRARSAAVLYAEGHYRLAAPLYNLVFALFAACAFFAVEHRRTGYARFIILAGAGAMILRLAGFAVQAAASDNMAYNVVQYALPVGGVVIGLIILNRPVRFLRRFRRAHAEASA